MAEVADVAVAFGLLNNSELNGRRIPIKRERSLRNGKANAETWRADNPPATP
jgi:hypothetical protein